MTRLPRFAPALLVLLTGSPVFGAESESLPVEEGPEGVVLQAERILEQDRRSQNTFRFTVVPQEGFAAPADSRILYFLDGRFVKDFGRQALPFALERDLDGQRAGLHEARVDIEAPDEELIARATASVEVSRPEAGGQETETAGSGSLRGEDQ